MLNTQHLFHLFHKTPQTKAAALISSWAEKGGVGAAYDHLREKATSHPWHKMIWKSFIPPRWSISMWMALRGRLKTLDRLTFIDIPRTCLICECNDETHDHLFFSCRKLVIIWDKIKRWLGLQRQMNSILSAFKYIKKERKGGSSILPKAQRLALAATVNHIWYARNLLHFEKVPIDCDKVTNSIKREVYTVLYSLFPVDKVLDHLPDKKL